MALSSRLATAVHIMVILAISEDSFIKSDFIAGSVNTNPAVVRKILAKLNKAGLINGLSGANGGSMLSKSPDKITLLDIYKAVEETELFSIHEGNEKCPISFNVKCILEKFLDKAENAMRQELSSTTIAEILDEINKNKTFDMEKIKAMMH